MNLRKIIGSTGERKPQHSGQPLDLRISFCAASPSKIMLILASLDRSAAAGSLDKLATVVSLSTVVIFTSSTAELRRESVVGGISKNHDNFLVAFDQFGGISLFFKFGKDELLLRSLRGIPSGERIR